MLSKNVLLLRRGKVLILAGLLLVSAISENLSAEEPNSEPNQVSEAIQSKPNCILCGHITDSETGQPVTDATVHIEGRYHAKTDTSGFYCLDKIPKDGAYRISVDSNEYVGIFDYTKKPIISLNSDKQAVKDFKLDKACMIEVQVVNEANEPIEGAELSATPLVGETYKKLGNPRRKRTDKEGILLIGGLPPSKTGYLITGTHGTTTTITSEDGHGISEKHLDYAPGKLTMILDDTNVIELGKMVLKKGVDVKGYAEYKDGVPASDLKIYASPDWGHVGWSPERFAIDANGNFAIRNIEPGIYRIMTSIPMGEESWRGVTITQMRLPLPNNEILKLTIPENSPGALVSIKGKFSFAGDKIPHYIHINGYSINNRYWPSSTWRYDGIGPCDANFAIDRLEPGKYRLTFSSNGMEDKIIEDVEAPSEGLIVELVGHEKEYFTGTVINSQTGQPIQKFKARLKNRLAYVQPSQWFEFDDADGKFSIERPALHVYQIQAAAEGFAWTCSEDVNPEENAPVVIKLSPGGGIKGRVINESGQPVNGAQVLALSKAGVTTIARTEEAFVSEDGAVETVDGVFELTHLATGEETIKVSHPDYMYSTVSGIEVKEGQVTEDIDVVLHKGGTVEGYVYDAQFEPQPNVTLCFKEQTIVGIQMEECLATVTTDLKGYYRVEGLPEEICNVRREGQHSGSMGVFCRTFVPAKGKVSRLDFGGQPNVTGQIVVDGAPISNRKITLSMIGALNSDFFRYYAMTDAEGKFAFGGVPHGRWAIYYDNIETINNQIKAAEFEFMDQGADLGIIPTGLATIRISIEQDKEAGEWEIIRAYLQDENKYWSQRVTQVAIPKDENEPYTAKNILPGEHYLVLSRKDYSTLRYPIEVSESEPNITIHIPKCTAGIHGRMTGTPAMQTIWTKDKSVIGVIKPDENLDYKLDNLPAGEYLLGGNMLIDSTAFLEFELAEGEQKVLDINFPYTPSETMGWLQILIVDENGVPLTAADARLRNGNRIIEPLDGIGGGFYFCTDAGTYTLQAEFPGYEISEQQVSIGDLSTLKQRPKPVIVRLGKK